MKKLNESYEVSEDLASKLNSILADEALAHQFYNLCVVAMKGNKRHELEEVAKDNGKDEFEDHYMNLCNWMQSKGIKVVTSYSEYDNITNCTKFDVKDGESTVSILDKLITSEMEAIDVYETIIPETELDLNTMLSSFLKDEREHLKKLQDIKDEIGEPNEEKFIGNDVSSSQEEEMVD